MSVVSFIQSVYQVKEGDGVIKVGVERTGDLSKSASVNVSNTSSTSSGRATRGIDYYLDIGTTSETLTWAINEGGIKYATFNILDDVIVERTEFIPLSLTSLVNCTKGDISAATLEIIDDDWYVAKHQWVGTALQLENPDGTWGNIVDLKGDRGEKGDKGDKGDRGEQGLMGLPGLPGLKGDKGEKGDRGEQGLMGLPGAKGDKGDKGDRGIQGLSGLKGDQGIQGPKGDNGVIGIVPVGSGGTGANNAFSALTNLGGAAKGITSSMAGSGNTFSTGWSEAPSFPVRITRFDNLVIITGLVTRTTGTGMIIFSLSGTSRPNHNIMSLVPAYYNNKYNFVRVDINSMGHIILNHSTDFAVIPSSISWLQLNFVFSIGVV